MKKLLFLLPVIFFFSSFNLLANKTSADIKAPSEFKKGTDLTLIINVMHNGNSKMHHTDWVSLKINGQEVKRWEYSKENLPPDGNFTLEYKVTVTDDMNIEAQGHCNMHGSAGVKSAKVKAN
jgi:desulfoferrodoxin (superoxide reductase-like protein)